MNQATNCQTTAFVAFTVIATCTFLLYQLGLPGAFLIDDAIRITVKNIPELSFTTIAHKIESTDVGLLGRPVSLASLFTTKFLYGNSPEAFKHENILLHLATGLTLFWLVYRLLRTPGLGNTLQSEYLRLACALIASGIWLLHPLHVSTVLYAVQRMTILAALFTSLALLCWVIGRQSGLNTTTGKLTIFLALPLLSLLAAFSKENGALIPLYLVGIELLAFRNVSITEQERRWLNFARTIMIAIPLCVGSIYLATHVGDLLQGYTMRQFTMPERIATQTVIMWKYLSMLLVPNLSEMSLYHDGVRVHTLSSSVFWLAAIGWAIVITISVATRKQTPPLTFGILLFIASHLMESSFLPLELMFEHRNYFGSIGLFLAVGYALIMLSRVFDRNYLTPGLTTIVILSLLGFQTATRASTWQNEELLLTITHLDHPRSDRASSALANTHLQAGRIEAARDVLRKAITLPPHFGRTGLRIHLLGTYCATDRNIPNNLYESVLRDVEHEPLTPYALSGLDVLKELNRLERCPGIDKSVLVSVFHATIRNPHGDKHRFRANFIAARFFTDMGMFPDAVTAYQQALQHRAAAPISANIRVLVDLADIQIHLGRLTEAEATVAAAKDLVSSSVLHFPAAEAALQNQLDAIQDQRTNNEGAQT